MMRFLSLVLCVVAVNAKSLSSTREVCNTPECAFAANDLIEAMDQTADPCADFFQYACGGWIEKNPIPEEKSRWGNFDLLRNELNAILKTILDAPIDEADPVPVNQAKELYNACLDFDTRNSIGIQPLKDIFDTFGGWPITYGADWQGEFDWVNFAAFSKNQFNVNIFFNTYVSLDIKNTSRSLIYIDQPSLTLSRSRLLNITTDPEKAELYQGYLNYVDLVVHTFNPDVDSLPQDSHDLEGTVHFESEMAEFLVDAADRRDNEAMYNPYTVAELQAFTDSIPGGAQMDWLDYLNGVFSGTDQVIDESTVVIVVEPEWISNVSVHIAVHSYRRIANHAMWRLARSLTPETAQAMIDAEFEFTKLITGAQKQELPWVKCVSKVNSYLGYAISNPYIQATFDDVAKQEMNEMVVDLKIAFKELVDELEWMSEETKPVAKEKADAMKELMAYPDWILDKEALEEYYSGLTIASESHFENIQSASNWMIVDEFRMLSKPTDRDRWITPPSIVNAFYSPEYNSISFPAGILQPPFFGTGRLRTLNYGAIGVVVGHEITHGFDDQGSQHDKFGNIQQWWDNSTLNNFNEKKQCFIDQYGNFFAEEVQMNVNGVTTQGENIADNGGLREAYRAYQRFVSINGPEPTLPGLDLTTEQLFFVSYANLWCGAYTPEGLIQIIETDPHSPNKYRVWGPLQNSIEFAEAFQCPNAAPMNPDEKCLLW
ncbi:neprilysin-like isoform X2 [Artemia franciscana]|uniref:neprilysin-like isoform X2 n=1 Tax=Artemia franciscana TaxID=6661 RepID=UPI0032DB7A13